MSASTVRAYLSAVRHLHITQGLGDPLVGHSKLELALKGLCRTSPQAKDQQLPITPLILRRLRAVLLVSSHTSFINSTIWAACLLCFLGFLRSGEITVSMGSFDPKWHIIPMDIAVDDVTNPTAMQIRLKASKTDQARAGSRELEMTSAPSLPCYSIWNEGGSITTLCFGWSLAVH